MKNKVFLLMELGEKGNLYNYIKNNRKLPEEEAVRMFYQVCSGIAYLHELNICHRDLKVSEEFKNLARKYSDH